MVVNQDDDYLMAYHDDESVVAVGYCSIGHWVVDEGIDYGGRVLVVDEAFYGTL